MNMYFFALFCSSHASSFEPISLVSQQCFFLIYARYTYIKYC